MINPSTCDRVPLSTLCDMDDLRLEWLMKQVNLSLGINQNSAFEDFLLRDSNEEELTRFLSNTTAGDKAKRHITTAFFYKQNQFVEIEEEVELPNGKK